MQENCEKCLRAQGASSKVCFCPIDSPELKNIQFIIGGD